MMGNPNPFEPISRLAAEVLELQRQKMQLLELLQERIDLAEEDWGEDDEWCQRVRLAFKELWSKAATSEADVNAPPVSC